MWILAFAFILAVSQQTLASDVPCKILDGKRYYKKLQYNCFENALIERNIVFSGNGTVVLDNSAACPPTDNCSRSIEMRKFNGDDLAYTLYFCSSALDIVNCAEEIVSNNPTGTSLP